MKSKYYITDIQIVGKKKFYIYKGYHYCIGQSMHLPKRYQVGRYIAYVLTYEMDGKKSYSTLTHKGRGCNEKVIRHKRQAHRTAMEYIDQTLWWFEWIALNNKVISPNDRKEM